MPHCHSGPPKPSIAECFAHNPSWAAATNPHVVRTSDCLSVKLIGLQEVKALAVSDDGSFVAGVGAGKLCV